MSEKYQKLKESYQKENQYSPLADKSIQLYEKGLLSGETLLEIVGFDPKEESKRKENDKQEDPSKYARSFKKDPIDILSCRIEQARRNIECLIKSCNLYSLDGWQEVSSLAKEAFKDNIVILKETKNIK